MTNKTSDRTVFSFGVTASLILLAAIWMLIAPPSSATYADENRPAPMFYLA